MIGRLGKVGGQKIRYAHRILDDLRNNNDDAGSDSREQHELDKEKGEIEVLRNDLTLTAGRCAHKDCQFS